MENGKSPGNNGLTKEFYETFWNELKEIFIESVSESKEKDQVNREKKIQIRDSYKTGDSFLY